MRVFGQVALVFFALFVAAITASAGTEARNHQYLCVDTGAAKPTFLAAASTTDTPGDTTPGDTTPGETTPGDSQIPVSTGIGIIAFACNGGSACNPTLTCPASGGPACDPTLRCVCVCGTLGNGQHVAVNSCEQVHLANPR